MIIVNILLAVICFGPTGTEECHNALIGNDTPVGQFETIQRFTNDAGYGGDVLKFDEDEKYIFAIHRVWTLRPQEKRRWRLEQPDPNLRKITKGCINVDETVYNKLIDCCANDKLLVE